MSSDPRDARAAAAFDRALDLEGDARDAFVRSLGDERADVEELLRSHAAMGASFLAATAAERVQAGAVLPAPGERIGRFVVESVVGRGASGTVFAARQDEPDRLVALKVLHDAFADPDDVARFRAEAAVLARLSHPDIAHVYEAGVHGGLPWLAMELVAGARPVTAFADDRRLARDDRVRLASRAAAALAHAHARGVVHRDVKPANLLVDAEGRLRVVDFGIAAAGAGRAETAGTPGWMSPEQARGEPADARADVYGLGAVLHALLTGGPPLDAASLPLDRALAAAAAAEPPALPAGAADPDLDAVRRTALANRRDDRYATAGEFGDDLDRWLARRPVRARPATAAHAAELFVRRRPALAAALVGAGLALVAGTVASTWFALSASAERRDAVTARDRAERQAYVAEIVAASAAIELRDVATARLALERAPERFRGFEWRHLSARLDESERSFVDPSFRPFAGGVAGGGAVAAAGTGPAGAALRTIVVATGASRDVPVPGAEHVTALHVLRGGASSNAPNASIPPVEAIVGRRDGTVLRIGADGAREAGVLHAGPVNAITTDAAGRRAATGGWDGKVRILDGALARTERVIDAHGDRVVGLRFSPAGDVLASCGREGLVRLWNPESGAKLLELAGHESGVEDAAFSPDGRRLATVSRDMTLRVWDLEGARPPQIRTGHSDNIRAVAWSADGTRIATASYDRTVGLWDAEGPRLLRRFAGHDAPVRSVGFDGRNVVSAATDGVRIWSEGRAPAAASFVPCRDRSFASLSLSPDGGRALLGGANGRATLLDLASGAEAWTADTGAPGPVRAVAPDWGETLSLVTNDGSVRRVEGSGGRAIGAQATGRGAVAAAFRTVADEPPLLVLADDDGLAWWDTRRNELVAAHPWERAMTTRSGAALDVRRADGLVLAGNTGGEAWIGGAEPGMRMRRISGGAAAVTACAFAPDGGTAALGRDDGAVEFVDPGTGRVVGSFAAHRARIRSIRWSPDGTRFVTAAEDRTIRLFEAASAAELLVLRTPWIPCDARFTADGGALVALALQAVDAPALTTWRTEK